MIEYRCPRCRGSLRSLEEAYLCEGCDARYPVVLGIPDFRIEPDPYLSIEDDRAKGRRLQEGAEGASFEELIRFYWSITPDTPTDDAERYVEYALAGVERGRELLDGLDRTLPAESSPSRALEIGCRTGGVLQAMAERVPEAIGIDVAFRWLVVARKGLEERGAAARLVCCNGEHLPFPDGTFDLTLAENVLEHARSASGILAEAGRTLRPEGRLLVTTWNRLALAPEPHVRLWGVGWLPRRWAHAYVRWRRGTDYGHVELLSVFGLRSAARAVGLRAWTIRLPDFGDATVSRLAPHQRFLIRMYERLKGSWPFRAFFRIVAPVLHLHARGGPRRRPEDMAR